MDKFYEAFSTLLFGAAFFGFYFMERHYEKKMEHQSYYYESVIELIRMTSDCRDECERILEHWATSLPSRQYMDSITQTVKMYKENPLALYKSKYKKELPKISYDKWNLYDRMLRDIEESYLHLNSCIDFERIKYKRRLEDY